MAVFLCTRCEGTFQTTSGSDAEQTFAIEKCLAKVKCAGTSFVQVLPKNGRGRLWSQNEYPWRPSEAALTVFQQHAVNAVLGVYPNASAVSAAASVSTWVTEHELHRRENYFLEVKGCEVNVQGMKPANARLPGTAFISAPQLFTPIPGAPVVCMRCQSKVGLAIACGGGTNPKCTRVICSKCAIVASKYLGATPDRHLCKVPYPMPLEVSA